MQNTSNIMKKLKKLYDDLKKLKKSKMRINEFRRREQDFVDQLDNLFDIAHANAIDLMRIQQAWEKIDKTKISTSVF